MQEYVTQEECEVRRKDLVEDQKKNRDEIAVLNGEIKALTVQIQHLVTQNRWFMGIVSTVLGGLLVWLITK